MMKTLILLTVAPIVLGQPNCPKFLRYLEDAKVINSLKHERNFILESKSSYPERNVDYVNSNLTLTEEADAFTIVAQLFAYRDGVDSYSFQDNAACLNRSEPVETSHPKYRTIDGYGNNLKHPLWGAAGTPFGRFGPKTYQDGIHSIRKSHRISQFLPSPRELVEKVLKKAKKTPRKLKVSNMMLLSFVGFLALDIGHSLAVESTDKSKIRCCSAGNKAILPQAIRHSSCIPITISTDDAFYNASGVRCMSVVRSQMITTASGVLAGEIRNKATSFADLSLIYGTSKEESMKIRSFSQGKLLLTSEQTLPVDAQGNFTDVAARLNVVATVGMWVVLLLRNHNNLAERLSVINPLWDDERVYQEARRINIAVFQNQMISKEIVENTFGSFVNEGYNEDVDPSGSVEFLQAVSRFNHIFVPSNSKLINSDGEITENLQSDMLGRADIIDKFSDDSLRGALNQSIFDDYYSYELQNKIGKNKDGIGGRDQGHPTWIEARRKCGLDANFTCFKDLRRVLRKSAVKLLKKAYDSVLDIDLYVGGALESFKTFDQQLFGPTFSCINKDQYRRMVSGDVYFFSHENNPNPFMASQLKAVKEFSFNNLLCTNSKLEFTNKEWLRLEDESNPKISCSNFKPMNLESWVDA